MKNFKIYLIAGVVAIMAAYISVSFFASDVGSAPQQEETVYERVMRTGTIRCGYSLWRPLLWVDPATQQPQGIFYDLMTEAAARLGLDVEWTAELGWGEVIEAIESNRVDMACAGYWLHPDRIRRIQSTKPLFYAPLHIWVRGDEGRSFPNKETLNSDQYTVALIDGGSSAAILDRYFPNVKKLSLPQTATNGDVIESLLTKKADFFVDDVTSFYAYLRENPGKLKVLFPDHPLAVFPATMLLPREQSHLKTMIDDTLRLIELDGTLDEILARYEATDLFLLNARPSYLVR